MTNIMIVESSGKIDKIKSFLPSGWEVFASFGHVRDLPDGNLGLIPPDFRVEYVLTDRGKDVVQRIKRSIKAGDTVYLATDPDREGEAIAWHLQETLKLQNPKRITFSEITQAAILGAIQSPRTINLNLVAAQQGRRLLDRAVGFQVSPILSNLMGKTLSAGRVQSPALRLVVERERAIRDFKPTKHFGAIIFINQTDDPAKEKWFMEWDTQAWLKTHSNVPIPPYILDVELAEAISKTKQVCIKAFDEKTSFRAPPPPFTTSTLQQAASVQLKMKPKRTMEIAQTLYEGGHITYMRTDSPNLSDEAISIIRAYAQAHHLDLPAKVRTWNAKAGAQEAHEAIRPTKADVAQVSTDKDCQTLYELIRQRAIASQLADAEYSVRTVTATSTLNTHEVIWQGKCRSLIKKGWLQLTDGDAADETKDQWEPNPIPKLTPPLSVPVAQGNVSTKITKAPSRYTEASLTKELENRGIGRPSTYVSIMQTLHERMYVEEKSRQLYATALGESVVSKVSGIFTFLEYGFTSSVEERLDQLASGTGKYRPLMNEFYETLMTEVNQFKQTIPTHPCPKCGQLMLRRGKADNMFWGCSAYPECKHTMSDDNGKPVEHQARPVVLSSHKCKTCQSFLIHKKFQDKNFWGCSAYPSCKTTYPDKKGKPDFASTQKSKN